MHTLAVLQHTQLVTIGLCRHCVLPESHTGDRKLDDKCMVVACKQHSGGLRSSFGGIYGQDWSFGHVKFVKFGDRVLCC